MDFVGYFKDPKRTAETVGGEYYNLHDMAWRDSDGYYFFIGRNDDVINKGLLIFQVKAGNLF